MTSRAYVVRPVKNEDMQADNSPREFPRKEYKDLGELLPGIMMGLLVSIGFLRPRRCGRGRGCSCILYAYRAFAFLTAPAMMGVFFLLQSWNFQGTLQSIVKQAAQNMVGFIYVVSIVFYVHGAWYCSYRIEYIVPRLLHDPTVVAAFKKRMRRVAIFCLTGSILGGLCFILPVFITGDGFGSKFVTYFLLFFLFPVSAHVSFTAFLVYVVATEALIQSAYGLVRKLDASIAPIQRDEEGQDGIELGEVKKQRTCVPELDFSENSPAPVNIREYLAEVAELRRVLFVTSGDFSPMLVPVVATLSVVIIIQAVAALGSGGSISRLATGIIWVFVFAALLLVTIYQAGRVTRAQQRTMPALITRVGQEALIESNTLHLVNAMLHVSPVCDAMTVWEMPLTTSLVVQLGYILFSALVYVLSNTL